MLVALDGVENVALVQPYDVLAACPTHMHINVRRQHLWLRFEVVI